MPDFPPILPPPVEDDLGIFLFFFILSFCFSRIFLPMSDFLLHVYPNLFSFFVFIETFTLPPPVLPPPILPPPIEIEEEDELGIPLKNNLENYRKN